MPVILVPTADRPECVFALDVAFRLAEELNAGVAGCHVRPQRHEAGTGARARVAAAKVVSEDHGAKPIDSRAARELFAAAAARHDFAITRRFAAHHRRRAIWHQLVGTPPRALGIAGRVADFSIVSRPKPQGGGRAREFLLAALLDTGRPVLVVPQRRVGSVGGRVVIAWNQSAEVAVAVTAAIPLLQRAERVVIVSGGAENRSGPKSAQLVQYLATFDVKAECVRTRGQNVESEIRQVYRDIGADLVVMGAYSRSRLREILFGGVTEHMLFATDLPVFMLHL
jgi:nucleotide-binding universal stress UspA family protein